MGLARHELTVRVRYSDIDKMGTYYNSRALEWFEQGRAELLRALGKPYREMESLGVMLPVSEAHVQFLGRAEYDDPLKVVSIASMPGKARLRVDVAIEHADTGRPVCRGYTVHAVTNLSGKPIRPPDWLTAIVPPSEA
jgi:acyl-CoA thioester hydrolase